MLVIFFNIAFIPGKALPQISFPKCSAPGAAKWQKLMNGLGRLHRSTGSYVSRIDMEPEMQIIYALFTVQGLRSHTKYRLCNCTAMGHELACLGLSESKAESQKQEADIVAFRAHCRSVLWVLGPKGLEKEKQ